MAPDDTDQLLTSWGLALHDHAQSTRRLYAEVIRHFAGWLDGGLLEATKRDCERYFAELKAKGRAQATLRSRWIALRNFYRWAHDEDEIDVNPMAGVKVARAEPPPPDVPDDHDLALLFKSLAGRGFAERRDLAMVRIAAATGLRIGELCALEVGGVDLANRVVRVRHGKGDKARLARMDPATGACLDRYLRARARHRLAASPALFVSRFGPLGRKGAFAMIRRRCDAAGIPPLRWHQLRHRFAHQWLAKGGQEGDLARLGGWEDASVMRRYGSALATERALAAYDDLGGVL
jgi:integrase/recombinase XerD